MLAFTSCIGVTRVLNRAGDEFYASIGNAYSGGFRSVLEAWVGVGEVLARLAMPPLDAPSDGAECAHLYGAAMLDPSSE